VAAATTAANAGSSDGKQQTRTRRIYSRQNRTNKMEEHEQDSGIGELKPKTEQAVDPSENDIPWNQ
jgi:hypothetical protein